jgi:gas vesicle protein
MAAESKKSTKAKGDDETPAGPGGESLDKVRDILFGSHARSTEQQISRLDKKVSKDVQDVRDEFKKRLESLEHYVKNELGSLNERLKAEQGERLHGDKELAQTFTAAGKTFEKRLNELDERTGENHRELRKSILDQSKALRDEISQTQRDLSALLERSFADLRQSKTDRFALADLLTDLALRLKDEVKGSSRKKD